MKAATPLGAWGRSVISLARRERPQLVLDAGGTPRYLSNGVQPDHGTDYTYTAVVAINNK